MQSRAGVPRMRPNHERKHMTTQTEAERLADQLEDPVNAKLYLAPYIAAELRREMREIPPQTTLERLRSQVSEPAPAVAPAPLPLSEALEIE